MFFFSYLDYLLLTLNNFHAIIFTAQFLIHLFAGGEFSLYCFVVTLEVMIMYDNRASGIVGHTATECTPKDYQLHPH